MDWDIIKKKDNNFSVLKENKTSDISQDDNVFFLPVDLPEEFNWVVELAEKEKELSENGFIELNEDKNIEDIIVKTTVEFLDILRLKSSKIIQVFNRYKSGEKSPIKLFRIKDSISDFALFRNSFKLIFSFYRPGVIEVSFLAYRVGLYSFNNNPDYLSNSSQVNVFSPDYIMLELGPFNEPIWTYQGQKINIDAMLRYYIERFIKESMV